MLTLNKGCFSSSVGKRKGKRRSTLARSKHNGIVVIHKLPRRELAHNGIDASPNACERDGIPAALICPRLFEFKARVCEQYADPLARELVAVLRMNAFAL